MICIVYWKVLYSVLICTFCQGSTNCWRNRKVKGFWKMNVKLCANCSLLKYTVFYTDLYCILGHKLLEEQGDEGVQGVQWLRLRRLQQGWLCPRVGWIWTWLCCVSIFITPLLALFKNGFGGRAPWLGRNFSPSEINAHYKQPPCWNQRKYLPKLDRTFAIFFFLENCELCRSSFLSVSHLNFVIIKHTYIL